MSLQQNCQDTSTPFAAEDICRGGNDQVSRTGWPEMDQLHGVADWSAPKDDLTQPTREGLHARRTILNANREFFMPSMSYYACSIVLSVWQPKREI